MTRPFVLLVAVAMALVGCGSTADNEPESTSTLDEAVESCGPRRSSPAGEDYYPHITIGDEGRTLTVRGGGDESDGVELSDIACILGALSATDAVLAQISGTRPLDGRQTGSWGNYSASWTYHPNSGLSLIIEEP